MSEATRLQHYFPVGFVPHGSYLLTAGAAGAMFGGGWTALTGTTRVRDREISREEAIARMVKNAAIGAGAGVLIGTAAHFAKAYPLSTVTVVLAAGAVALYLAERGQEQEGTRPARRRR